MTPISVLFLCARSLCLTNPEEFSVHCFKWRHKHVRLLIWRRLHKKKINSVMLRQYIISFFQAVFRSCCFLINEVCKTALWFSDQVAKPASCSLSCFFSANTTFSSFVLAVPKFFPCGCQDIFLHCCLNYITILLQSLKWSLLSIIQ